MKYFRLILFRCVLCTLKSDCLSHEILRAHRKSFSFSLFATLVELNLLSMSSSASWLVGLRFRKDLAVQSRSWF